MVDKSPAEDKLLQREVRVWEPKEHRPTLTWSRSGYKPYSTYVSSFVFIRGRTDRIAESRTSTLHGHLPSRHASKGPVSFVSIVYIEDKSKVKVHVQFGSTGAGSPMSPLRGVQKARIRVSQGRKFSPQMAQSWTRMATCHSHAFLLQSNRFYASVRTFGKQPYANFRATNPETGHEQNPGGPQHNGAVRCIVSL